MMRATPRHLQWREALFPKSVAAITIPLYGRLEAGLRGRLYNLTVGILRTVTTVLNLVCFIPMMAVIIIWFLVTSPVNVLRLVLSPGSYMRFIGWTIVPAGEVLIWIVTSPVKLTNLTTALVVYMFGPKSAFYDGWDSGG